MTESVSKAVDTFATAPTWETASRADGTTSRAEPEVKRGTARWLAARRLLADGQWLGFDATAEQRTQLQVYLYTLIAMPTLEIDACLDALDLGLSSGLITLDAARGQIESLLWQRGINSFGNADVIRLARWLRDRALLAGLIVQRAIGEAICRVDQDDRRRILAALLAELPPAGVASGDGIVGCLVAACERLAELVNAVPVTAAHTAEYRDPLASGATTSAAPARADQGEEDSETAPGAPRSTPERLAKVCSDLRLSGAAWLARRPHEPDASLLWRLLRVSLVLWTSPRADAPTAQRAVIQERRQTSMALLDAALTWRIGADALAALLVQSEIETSSYLAAIDALWRAGQTTLFARLARRLIAAKPTTASAFSRPDLPPLDVAARLTSILTGVAEEELAATRTHLAGVALMHLMLRVPANQRLEALGLHSALEPLHRDPALAEARLNLPDTPTMAEAHRNLVAGLQQQALALLDSEEAIPAGLRLPIDTEFRSALHTWAEAREAKAAALAEESNAALRQENLRLEQELHSTQAERARLERNLEEARAVGQATRGGETSSARLPLLRQVTSLADLTDRLLLAGDGDYETLSAMRERIHDILAEHDVQVMGQIGERTRFDPDLFEYVGEKGVQPEWFEILESGYVILSDGEPIILKRVLVRAAT